MISFQCDVIKLNRTFQFPPINGAYFHSYTPPALFFCLPQKREREIVQFAQHSNEPFHNLERTIPSHISNEMLTTVHNTIGPQC